MCLLCGLCMAFCYHWDLIAVGTSVGGIDSQSDWQWEMAVTTVEKLLCKSWPHGTEFSLAGLLVPIKSTFWLYHLWRWLGGSWCGFSQATKSVGSGTSWEETWKGQGQLLPVPKLEPPGMCYICWSVLVASCARLRSTWERLSCEASKASCHKCHSWGYLESYIGHTEAKHYLFEGCEPLRDFRNICSTSRDTSFVWKRYWNQLGWPHNLDGAGSQELTRVWQTGLVRSMKTQTWHPLVPAGWVGRELNNCNNNNNKNLLKLIHYSYTPLEWPESRTLTTPDVDENVEQLKLSFICDMNAKWYSHFVRVWWLLIKLNILLPQDLTMCSLVFTRKSWKLLST